MWVPILLGDSRVMVDANTMPDRRVEHFWDGDKAASAWLAIELDGYEGYAWDVYYLYGPEAVWEDIPEPRIGVGTPVIGERDTLMAELKPMIDGQ